MFTADTLILTGDTPDTKALQTTDTEMQGIKRM